MASLEPDKASGRFHIRLRYGGVSYKRSLKAAGQQEANSVLGWVEETLRLLERGRLEIPPDAAPGVFILSALDSTSTSSPRSRGCLNTAATWQSATST